LVIGSFLDENVILKAFTSSIDTINIQIKSVIVMAIDRSKPLYMSQFMDSLLIPTMKKFGVKKILYQAGRLCILPNEKKMLFGLRLFRSTFCRWTGMLTHVRDNDAVLALLSSNSESLDWIVTRPSLLIESIGTLKDMKYRLLERNSKASSFGIRFIDLAMYSLRLMDDESAIHSADYVSYAKNANKELM
jgi:hypothetical protein